MKGNNGFVLHSLKVIYYERETKANMLTILLDAAFSKAFFFFWLLLLPFALSVLFLDHTQDIC